MCIRDRFGTGKGKGLTSATYGLTGDGVAIGLKTPFVGFGAYFCIGSIFFDVVCNGSVCGEIPGNEYGVSGAVVKAESIETGLPPFGGVGKSPEIGLKEDVELGRVVVNGAVTAVVEGSGE